MQDENSKLLSEVKVNGRVIPLKSIKLREAFAALTEIEKQISELKAADKTQDITAQNKLISLQLNLINMLDEVVQLITKEKKEEQMRSDASGQLYNSLLAHVTFMKLTNTKERNLLQAETLARQLDMDVLLGSGFGNKKEKLNKEQKPQNIIRFIEKALKAQRALSAFDREQESVTGAVNTIKQTVNEFEEIYFDTLIAYYVTLHYINDRKYLEAVHLSKHTLSQVENCLDFANRSSSSLGDYQAKVNQYAEHLEKQIAINAKKLQIKAHAKNLAAEAESELLEKKNAMKAAQQQIDTKKKPNCSVQLDSLYDLLYD